MCGSHVDNDDDDVDADDVNAGACMCATSLRSPLANPPQSHNPISTPPHTHTHICVRACMMDLPDTTFY